MTGPINSLSVESAPSPVDLHYQPGDGFSHYCSVHLTWHECERAPTACVAHCGYSWGDDDPGAMWDVEGPLCIVCGHVEGVLS